MEELFISYNVAKILKTSGFDELCFAKYLEADYDAIDKLLVTNNPTQMHRFNSMLISDKSILISAPLYQQAILWFQNTHNLHIYAKQGYGWDYYVETMENHPKIWAHDGTYDSYIDALISGIEEALKIINEN